jgi:hypothetical protein
MSRYKIIEKNKSKCLCYLLSALVAFKTKTSTNWCFHNKLRLLSQSLKNFQKLALFAGLSISQLTVGLHVDAADSKLSSKVFLDTNGDGIPDLIDSSPSSNLLFLHKSKREYGKNPKFLKTPFENPGFDADLVGALELYPSWYWRKDTDLVALKKATGEYATFKNNGSNSFGPKFSLLHSGSLNKPIKEAIIADVDGDGKDDLVYASPGSIGWLKNDGGSNGFLPQGQLIGGLSNDISSLDLVDYDQDGDKEIKYRQGNVSGLSENNGSEGFTPVSSYDSAEDFHFHQDDLNNDGRPDSMTVKSDGQVGYIHSGSNQNKLFSLNEKIDSSFLHDLDGNGYKDLVYLTPDNKIGWAKNDGSDGFIAQPMLHQGLSPIEDLSLHDFDYDGDKDVYFADSGTDLGILKNNILGKIYNNQNQKFSAIRIDSENSTDFASSSAIDANHDGKKDLIFPTQGGVGWAKSLGSEGFLAQTGEALAFSPDSLASLDLDFDGDDDLIALNSSTGQYSVLSNWSRGSDGFDVTLQGDLSSPAKNAILEDIDMDGHQDLVFSDDNDVIWGKSDGSNGFLPQLPIVQGLGKLNFLESGDYDADGDPDFFYAQQDQATVRIGIIKNNGAGGFSVQYLNVTATSSVDDLKLADMDGDGDQDLVLASSKSSALALLSNQGTDGFSTDTLLASGLSKVDQIKIADLDLDDDLDIIAVSSENDDGFWIRNSTDGFIPFQLG